MSRKAKVKNICSRWNERKLIFGGEHGKAQHRSIGPETQRAFQPNELPVRANDSTKIAGNICVL